MKRVFFVNAKYEELTVPTHTGSIKIYKNDIVEGNFYTALVNAGFLVPLVEEEIKEKVIKYKYYTSPYLISH